MSLYALLSIAMCSAAPTDTLNYVPLNHITVIGHISKKIDQCIVNRVEEQSASELVEPFTHKNEKQFWQTEFWGKWILSAIVPLHLFFYNGT